MTTPSSTLHTCPACGLLCDDIAASAISSQTLSCERAARFYARSVPATPPQVCGQAVSLTAAIDAAARLLQQAHAPLIAGCSTDVHGARALVSLARHTHATVTHLNAASTLRNMQVLQHRGWQTTTLTEVRNRCDVLLLVGTDVVSHNPRFFERVIWVDEAMFTAPQARQIIYIGPQHLNTQPGTAPDGRAPHHVVCEASAIPAVVSALRALILDRPVTQPEVAGVPLETLQALAQTLKSAHYATLAWVAKDLHDAHADLTIETLCETVAALNQQSRAMGLPLGGSDGDTSVNYAHTWLQGVIPQAPELANHDALVWVNSFSPQQSPPAFDGPTLVLGPADAVLSSPPAVFIPIATPGLDSAGQQFRVDGSVTLPLSAVTTSAQPTLSEIVARLVSALEGVRA